MIWALLSLAVAQDAPDDVPTAEPPPAEPAPQPKPTKKAPDPDEEEYSEEVVVYAQLRVEQAREKVIEDLLDLGYTKVIEKGDAIVLRNEATWKGDVWLHDDGWMRIKRQPVQVQAPATPWGKKNSAGAWAGCVLYPFACVRPGGQLVGTRKFRAVEDRTASAVNPGVSEWSDRVADLAVDTKVDALPDRLQSLWDDGVPMEEGAPTLATVDERKAAILKYWETRTETPWGEAIRQAVEGFVLGEIQGTANEFTDAEIDAFNQRSRAGRPFSLDRRVADD
ncbi:MAG: hypothetical protein H6737_11550 [Alphaproteobacteria bacterium]|nr:hypothetical protein [Alphaproteobacteria bacterium]